MRFLSSAANDNPLQGALLRAARETGELSIASLRALSPLSDRAQILVDKAVVSVGLQRLVVTADIMAAGLTYPLTDPLSVTQLEWETISKTGGAQRTMDPAARGENQLPDRTAHRLPIYCTTDDFNVGIRTLKMSQRVGQPLDTTMVEQATRRVNEAIEDATINGAGITVAGYGAPGLLNAPNANTYTIPLAWNAAGNATGAQVQADIMAMVAKLQTDLKYGPYNLYVGTAFGNWLENDFKENGNESIRQRMTEMEFGGKKLQIKTADQMPATTAVLVQMTRDVVEIVNGQPPTVIPWTDPSGFHLYWLVLAILVPRVRSDYDGNSGIVVATV